MRGARGILVGAAALAFGCEPRGRICSAVALSQPSAVEIVRPDGFSCSDLDVEGNRQHSGAKRGVGAVYEWSGNKKVGRGRMEILESVSPAHVAIKLDFFAPFEAHNRAEFTFRAVGSQTEVVWAMSGPKPFVSKVMTVVLNLEKLVGKDFEKGLAQLKAKAES